MSDTYNIIITKSGPEHWIINTILTINPYKLEVVVGGKTIREGIINSIDALMKKVSEEELSIIVEKAVQDLESIL